MTQGNWLQERMQSKDAGGSSPLIAIAFEKNLARFKSLFDNDGDTDTDPDTIIRFGAAVPSPRITQMKTEKENLFWRAKLREALDIDEETKFSNENP